MHKAKDVLGNHKPPHRLRPNLQQQPYHPLRRVVRGLGTCPNLIPSVQKVQRQHPHVVSQRPRATHGRSRIVHVSTVHPVEPFPGVLGAVADEPAQFVEVPNTAAVVLLLRLLSQAPDTNLLRPLPVGTTQPMFHKNTATLHRSLVGIVFIRDYKLHPILLAQGTHKASNIPLVLLFHKFHPHKHSLLCVHSKRHAHAPAPHPLPRPVYPQNPHRLPLPSLTYLPCLLPSRTDIPVNRRWTPLT